MRRDLICALLWLAFAPAATVWADAPFNAWMLVTPSNQDYWYHVSEPYVSMTCYAEDWDWDIQSQQWVQDGIDWSETQWHCSNGGSLQRLSGSRSNKWFPPYEANATGALIWAAIEDMGSITDDFSSPAFAPNLKTFEVVCHLIWFRSSGDGALTFAETEDWQDDYKYARATLGFPQITAEINGDDLEVSKHFNGRFILDVNPSNALLDGDRLKCRIGTLDWDTVNPIGVTVYETSAALENGPSTSISVGFVFGVPVFQAYVDIGWTYSYAEDDLYVGYGGAGWLFASDWVNHDSDSQKIELVSSDYSPGQQVNQQLTTHVNDDSVNLGGIPGTEYEARWQVRGRVAAINRGNEYASAKVSSSRLAEFRVYRPELDEK